MGYVPLPLSFPFDKNKEFFFRKRIRASINKRQLNSKKDTSSFYQIPAYQDKRGTRNNSKRIKLLAGEINI